MSDISNSKRAALLREKLRLLRQITCMGGRCQQQQEGCVVARTAAYFREGLLFSANKEKAYVKEAGGRSISATARGLRYCVNRRFRTSKMSVDGLVLTRQGLFI